MKILKNLLHVFDDITNETLGITYNQLNAEFINFTPQIIHGYAHTLDNGNAILLAENTRPYLINANTVNKHHVHTGDEITAEVAYDINSDKVMVTAINHIKHIAYDTAAAVPATQTLTIKDQTVQYGTSNMVMVPNGTDITTNIYNLCNQLPDTCKKILLSLDGRSTTMPANTAVFRTNLQQSNREKLTVCLITLMRAKELAVAGHNVVLCVDSLERMFTIYNDCMQLQGNIDPNLISKGALLDFENTICASKCLTKSASLTLVGLHRLGITSRQEYLTDRMMQLFDVVI